ncbi:MAG: 3-phosphoshikimate 1-carboxyvinyltransferase [Ardenticatenales bacterium]
MHVADAQPDPPPAAPQTTPSPGAASARLRVTGGRPLAGDPPLVGDKSLSHRVLVLGALADGPTRIANLSPCHDVQRTRAAVDALGARVRDVGDDRDTGDRVGGGDVGDGRIVIVGRGPAGLDGPQIAIDCGDSGTTMRLLAGLLAGQRRAFTLRAASGLGRRPMGRVIAPLAAMGARIESEGGHAPLRGQGGGLRGADLTLDIASAQVGSAILLAALNAVGTTRVRYPSPVRDHTERMLRGMGAPIDFDERQSVLSGPIARLQPPGGGDYVVPEDPSAAAFVLAAAAIVPGSSVRLRGVGLNPGRTGFLDALRAMGADVRIDAVHERHGEPVGDVSLRQRALHGTTVGGALVPRAIDELPLLAVVATQAAGTTVIRDAAELRVKESDRLATIAAGLRRLGADIVERPDGLTITGPTPLFGAAVDGADDHRIVMALAVAGLAAAGTTHVSDAWRVGDSYPRFVEALVGMGADAAVEGE